MAKNIKINSTNVQNDTITKEEKLSTLQMLLVFVTVLIVSSSFYYGLTSEIEKVKTEQKEIQLKQ